MNGVILWSRITGDKGSGNTPPQDNNHFQVSDNKKELSSQKGVARKTNTCCRLWEKTALDNNMANRKRILFGGRDDKSSVRQ